MGCDLNIGSKVDEEFLISTHTSRVGCDVDSGLNLMEELANFYSHIPCGM